MKTLFCAAWLLAAAPAGAAEPAKVEMASEPFKVIRIKEFEARRKKDSRVTLFDANAQSIRVEYGVITGAKMLSSPSHYAVAELPEAKDTPVVFYCGNTHCLASHMAAKLAVDNGFTDVSVLADGIMGWKKAGMPTSKAPPKPQS